MTNAQKCYADFCATLAAKTLARKKKLAQMVLEYRQAGKYQYDALRDVDFLPSNEESLFFFDITQKTDDEIRAFIG